MPALALIGALLLAPPPPPTDPPPDFQATIERAQRLWAQGDNAEVAALFERAHAIDPRPEYLFGWARAEIAMGHCPRGLELLDQLEASTPPAPIQQASQDVRAQCETSPATPAPTAPAPVEPTDPTPAEAPDSAAPDSAAPDSAAPDSAASTPATPEPLDLPLRPWSRDRLGWALTGSGLVVGAIGLGLWGGAAGRLSRPPPTADENALLVYSDRWRGVGLAGIATVSVGGALVMAGLVRFAVRARRSSTPSSGRTARR
ncbi:MAG: hypothetical protein AAGF11_12855 [Myxococcota bacterium]